MRVACAASSSENSTLLEALPQHARDDVLPAVRLEHGRLDLAHARRVACRVGDAAEVARVGRGLRLQDAVDRADQRDQVVDRGVALGSGRASRLPCPFQLVEDRVLRLLLPVEQEDVLPQLGQASASGDAGAVVGLREQLDVAASAPAPPRCSCRARTPATASASAVERVAGRHVGRHHRFDAAEQLLVLQLLVGDAHQRLQRDLVAEAMVAADLQHLAPMKRSTSPNM